MGVSVVVVCVIVVTAGCVQCTVQCTVQGAAAGRHRSDIWAGCGPHPVSPLSDTTYSDTPPLSPPATNTIHTILHIT